MIRRVFLLSLAAVAVAPVLRAQEAAPFNALALRQAFEALTEGRRKRAQTELQTGGFYDGVIDGRYGPATEAALAAAAGFIAYNSRGAVRPDLLPAPGAAAFCEGLASGALARYLYGEGDECDSC